MTSKYRTRDFRPYALVHATARGLNKQAIFRDDIDRDELWRILRSQLNCLDRPDRPALLAFALMANHIHLLMYLGQSPAALTAIMNGLKRTYARRFNERHDLSGRLWEAPFRARSVHGGVDIVNVVTYIHLNPDATLRNEHSSHPIYTGEETPGIIRHELALKAFGGRDGYLDHFSDTARLRTSRAAAGSRFWS